MISLVRRLMSLLIGALSGSKKHSSTRCGEWGTWDNRDEIGEERDLEMWRYLLEEPKCLWRGYLAAIAANIHGGFSPDCDSQVFPTRNAICEWELWVIG